MATSPKPPDYSRIPPADQQNPHARVQRLRGGKFPWIIFAIIVAAAILIVIFAVLWRAPNPTAPAGAVVPQQPTGQQVEFTNLLLVPAPVSNAVYLDGVLHNAGKTAITGVEVKATFLRNSGAAVATIMAPVEGMVGNATQDFTRSPLEPGQSRPIQIYFEHTPAGWDHKVPQLAVVAVTGTTP